MIWTAVGGRATLAGPIIGAVLVNAGKSYFTGVLSDSWLFVLGGLFVAVTLFLPQGHRRYSAKGWTGLRARRRCARREGHAPPRRTAACAGVIGCGARSRRQRRIQAGRRNERAASPQPALSQQRHRLLRRVRALNGLSLVVDTGEMRAIIGPNGAGKTTMMDVITGKTRPDEGEVFFEGSDRPTKHDEAEIAGLGIGRKFQKPTVFEFHTVWDNLELALKGDRGVFATLFHSRTAPRRRGSRRFSSTIRLGDNPRQARRQPVSHGQKQWLEIGMLLAQDPKLLLVDEPAAGMTDEETAETAQAAEGHRQDAFRHRGRARHDLRARARRQGHRACTRARCWRRARWSTSAPTRASSKFIWDGEA